MEIELTVNGKSVIAHVDESQLIAAMKKPKKKTGYEHRNSGYYYVYTNGEVKYAGGPIAGIGEEEYKCGNMYTDKSVAENNARADELMRDLRRFAAEHGGFPSYKTYKYSAYEITYLEMSGELSITRAFANHVGNVLFMTKEAAQLAADIFHDKLIWYFTEYDPMPEGWWDD